MTDFRAMCAELLTWAERTSSHYYKQADVIVRARALLAEADGPAVSGDREPASVAMQPSDDAIAAPLSPAAQAVLDAFTEDNSIHDWKHNHYNTEALAAALRAAADQVVPPALEEEFYDRNHALPLQKMVEIRQKLNAIAAELEGL